MRKIYMVGMSHKVAEIAIREKFYIPMDIKIGALQNSPFDELLILATCNRTEVYVASDTELEPSKLVHFICDLVHQNYDKFSKYFYTKKDENVVNHVMNVCAGLDSVAMGEDQILHQIDRAYETAHHYNATGITLNKLFQNAVHTTKRIKTETNLNKLSCNIPFLAMKQVQKFFSDLENRSVYIIGLGEMGSLMLKYVQENTTKIFASSRTLANATQFADVLTPISFEDRYTVIGKCDVVVLCSACLDPIVTYSEFKAVVSSNVEKHLIIDLGSPRNADASIGDLPNVEYICVDDLEKVVSENRRLRMVELEAAQKILQEGINEFLQWFYMDDMAKEIHIFADKMIQMADEECKKLLQSMPNMPDDERYRIQMMYVRFAKKMANDYLYKVKDCNTPAQTAVFLECLRNAEVK